VAVIERGAAVERRGRLHAHPGAPAQHAREETDVEFARGIGEQPALHLDAGGAQLRETIARDQRVRGADRRHNPGYAGLQQRVAAWWRAAVMRAGLERDVDGRAARILAAGAGVLQRGGFGMRSAGLLGVASADHPALWRDDDAAHARVRLAEADRVD